MQEVAKLKIKVVPGASRSGISGWLGDALKVRVAAPPEKGKANDAVIQLLAKALEVPESSISIAAGKTSRQKTVEIAGIPDSVVMQRLGASRA